MHSYDTANKVQMIIYIIYINILPCKIWNIVNVRDKNCQLSEYVVMYRYYIFYGSKTSKNTI